MDNKTLKIWDKLKRKYKDSVPVPVVEMLLVSSLYDEINAYFYGLEQRKEENNGTRN